MDEVEFKYRDIPSKPWTDDIFSSLLDVGTKKAVGYLPLETIYKHGGDIGELTRWAYDKALRVEMFALGTTASGALYMWDQKMLSELLHKHREVLIDAGIPLDTYEYCKDIEHNTYYSEKYPEAYRIIGLTFNDERFREDG